MGLFSRRKSSVQSFRSPLSKENQPYYEKAPQLHPLPGEEGFLFNFPPQTPLNDGTTRTNNSMDIKPPPSRRLAKPYRPTTAQSDLSFLPPKLTPKTTKKNERPPSAASRVFFNNGQPISSTGKFIAPRSRLAGGSAISLPNEISATNLRSSASVRSLKVKSFDLLKSNPRLKYVIPDIPPLPPSRSNELQFYHDGRGLFASKTVANLADELDTRGLRKLLDRDMRRYQSSYELRKQYYYPLRYMPERILQSRGDTVSRGNTVSTDGFESYGYPSERAYNPFSDSAPSTIRPVFGSSDRSESMDSQRFESSHSYRMPSEDTHFRAYNNRMPSEDTQSPEPQLQEPINNSPGNHELRPVLLFGKNQNEASDANQPRSDFKEESPIVFFGPNSAQSTETESAVPRSPNNTPIHLHSQPPASDFRPRMFTFAADTALAADTEHDTGEGFRSKTPRDLSNFDNESWEECHNTPVIRRDDKDLTPQASHQRFLTQHDLWLPDLNTGPSDTESSSTLEFEDEDDHHSIFHPHTTWGESAVKGTSIPFLLITESNAFPGSRDSPIESEGSWLSGRMDIEQAVRKSFHATSPRRTPPILLESSSLPQVKGQSPLKIDTIAATAAMNARAWSSGTKPDDEREEYGSSCDELGGGLNREKVRQGTAARRVEVVDSPNVEGFVGRVSGESVERDFLWDTKGEIVLA